jgi:hypothetical protein
MEHRDVLRIASIYSYTGIAANSSNTNPNIVYVRQDYSLLHP